MLLLPLYFIKINISESKYLVMIGGITRVRIKKQIKKKFRKGNIFNYLNHLINEFEILKKELLSKGEFLKPGKYKVISVGSTIIYKDEHGKRFIEKQALKHSRPFPILRVYIKKLISVFLESIFLSQELRSIKVILLFLQIVEI